MDIRPWDRTQDIFLPLSHAEYAALRESIAGDGFLGTIRVLPDGRIIDGHHRWQAAIECGVEVSYEIDNISEEEAVDRAYRLNRGHRQVTPEQLLEVYKRLREQEGGEARVLRTVARELRDQGWAQAKIAKELRVSQKTISVWENERMHIIHGYNVHTPDPHDLRIKIPKSEYYTIHERVVVKGETQAQVAADYSASQPTVSRIVKRVEKERAKDISVEQPGLGDLPVDITLVEGDFRDVASQLEDESVDLIFTDPPYAEQYIPLYGDLASIAQRVLKPGCSLITYAGHYALPRIFDLMCPYLRYWWLLVVEHSGSSARLPGKWVFVEQKPLLWFVKDHRRDRTYLADLINSQPPKKILHEWEQGTQEARYCIERLTSPSDLVVDPFCGSGTTAIASVLTGRRVWSCDVDPQSLAVAKERTLICQSNV